MRKLSWLTLAFILVLPVLFVSTASADLVIDQSYQLVNKKRVGRTTYEYTYQVNISNDGSDAQDVTASVISSSPHTTIVDGDVNFGDVTGGSTVTGADTFSFRQNRRYPFDPSTLSWDVQSDDGNGLPPDPGEEGKLTLLGIDSDGDGVRDDIQRYIYFTYPDDEKLRLGLTYYAKEFQGVFVDADDREATYDHAIKMARHGECLFYLKDEESINIRRAIRAEILNTRERSIAYITYGDNLGGRIISKLPLKEWKDSCSFDVDNTGGGQ